MELAYKVVGFGENHVSKILLPVRPAVAWRETAGVKRIGPNEKFEPEKGRFTFREYDSPVGDLTRSVSPWPAGIRRMDKKGNDLV